MCRANRKCPNCGGRTPAERRENARIRKQRSEAGKALRAALNQGDHAAAHVAELRLRSIAGGDATADKILDGLRYPYGVPQADAEVPGPPATIAEPEPEELSQTKTGGPAQIDAWLADLCQRGYRIVSTSEEQSGRRLRVTARYVKIAHADHRG